MKFMSGPILKIREPHEYNEKYRLLTNALDDKIEELYAKELAEAISRYEDSKDPNGRYTSRYLDYARIH